MCVHRMCPDLSLKQQQLLWTSALFHLPADLAATLFDQFKAFPPTPLANTRFPSIPEFDKPCFIQDFSILLTKFFNFRKLQLMVVTRVDDMCCRHICRTHRNSCLEKYTMLLRMNSQGANWFVTDTKGNTSKYTRAMHHTHICQTHLNFCTRSNRSTNTLRKYTTLLPISSPGATWVVTWRRSTSVVNTISLYSPKQDSCRGKK